MASIDDLKASISAIKADVAVMSGAVTDVKVRVQAILDQLSNPVPPPDFAAIVADLEQNVRQPLESITSQLTGIAPAPGTAPPAA